MTVVTWTVPRHSPHPWYKRIMKVPGPPGPQPVSGGGNPLRRRGLSLLELMVALAVFAVAFLMLLAVFPTAARAVRQGEDRMVATFLAERRLEELRAADFDTVVDGFAEVPVESSNAGVANLVTYTVQTDVENVAGFEPDLKSVRVVVSWNGERARWVEVTTYVARLR